MKTRYATWDSGIGQRVESGSTNFDELTEWVKQNGEPVLASGRQELLENILNELL